LILPEKSIRLKKRVEQFAVLPVMYNSRSKIFDAEFLKITPESNKSERERNE